MRQQGEDQNVFRRILKNISIGEVSQEDWKILMERQYSRQGEDTVRQFFGATYLFPFKEQVKECNENHLRRLNRPICYIKAEDNFLSQPDQNADCENLEKELKICIGCKVMLRYNLDINNGLVNGSIGYVEDIVFEIGDCPPHKRPKLILVRFPQSKFSTLVPIAPITKTWHSGLRKLSRKQFPISLAYSLTLHKSQGLTLDKVILNIGSKEQWLGGTYVALSRVRKFEDFLFETSYDYSRFQKIGQSKSFKFLIEELKRLKKLSMDSLCF